MTAPTDPFAHGTPVGDDHMWVRPQNPPCPHCACCTEALCRRAVAAHGACHHFGSNADFDLTKCPCWRRDTAGYTAYTTPEETR